MSVQNLMYVSSPQPILKTLELIIANESTNFTIRTVSSNQIVMYIAESVKGIYLVRM